MYKKLIIAIDGPAGSGKSTSAKKLAEYLDYLYIDTGAMYRTITYLALKNNVVDDIDAVIKLARETKINLQFISGKTIVEADGNDVTEEIRSQNVNYKVSDVSKIKEVRKALVNKQRELADDNVGVVVEGRDTSTVVFPQADIKIFLTATIEQRASRRVKEFESKGIKASLEDVKNNILERDRIDSTRLESPLTKPPDAIEVDTSNITIEEQVDIILEKVKEAALKKGVKLPHEDF